MIVIMETISLFHASLFGSFSRPLIGLTDHGTVSSPNILSCTEHRKLWISWDNNAVRLGYGWNIGAQLIDSFHFPNFYNVQHVSVSGYMTYNAHFIFVD